MKVKNKHWTPIILCQKLFSETLSWTVKSKNILISIDDQYIVKRNMKSDYFTFAEAIHQDGLFRLPVLGKKTESRYYCTVLNS